MAADDNPDRDLKSGTPDERVLREAKRRYKRCESHESKFRIRFNADTKFANGDSDNHWQWEDAIYNARELDDAPCLTINKVRQHNLQIINDARQNKPSVSVKAVGNGATYEAAEVYEGVVRHIEYTSNAQAAYDTATVHQVEGGIGYWRLATDYVDDETFDQEIFIRRVKDPMSIYLDPDIKELDGSDAKFGFVFDDIERDDFDAKFPQYKDYVTGDPLGNKSDTSWLSSTKVRMAEYFRVIEKKDKLLALKDPETGAMTTIMASKAPKELVKAIVDDPSTGKSREITHRVVERYLIVGDKIVPEETTIWPGNWIPIIRIVGEETEIDGELDRRGHTRAMKDPQRMYNYWSSSAVGMVALQSISPYVGTMEAFEGFETYWDTANRVSHAWLPYNGRDDQGQPIPPPARQSPPVMAQAYIQGMTLSSDELRAVSGQYQSQMGMPSNEQSGVAIMQRQRQGDNATYHFIDHLAAGIRFTGKQLIDLIPKIYDTPRIIKILAEDGVEHEVMIDPNAQQAYLQKRQQQAEKVQSIFNPKVGKYDVEADIGPAYATRRQEAFNAFTQIASKNPKMMDIAGDLMFKAADFPMADELAERFKRIIPPEVLGDAPPPQLAQMQQTIQGLQQALMHALEEVADAKKKATNEAQDTNIDAYRATTDRLDTLLDKGIMPDGLQLVIQQMINDAMTNPMSEVVDASDVSVAPAAAAGQEQAQQSALGPMDHQMPQGMPPMPMGAPDMMAVAGQ